MLSWRHLNRDEPKLKHFILKPVEMWAWHQKCSGAALSWWKRQSSSPVLTVVRQSNKHNRKMTTGTFWCLISSLLHSKHSVWPAEIICCVRHVFFSFSTVNFSNPCECNIVCTPSTSWMTQIDKRPTQILAAGHAEASCNAFPLPSWHPSLCLFPLFTVVAIMPTSHWAQRPGHPAQISLSVYKKEEKNHTQKCVCIGSVMKSSQTM